MVFQTGTGWVLLRDMPTYPQPPSKIMWSYGQWALASLGEHILASIPNSTLEHCTMFALHMFRPCFRPFSQSENFLAHKNKKEGKKNNWIWFNYVPQPLNGDLSPRCTIWVHLVIWISPFFITLLCRMLMKQPKQNWWRSSPRLFQSCLDQLQWVSQLDVPF